MAAKKLVWAIDCDDVVVSTSEVWINAYNDRYHASVGLDALYGNNEDPILWNASSSDEARRRVNVLFREGVSGDVAPTKETIEALTYLASMDELHMVTGRQSFFEEATHTMLNRYLPGVFTTVEHTNYFAEAGSGVVSRSKGEVCAAIGADVLIDDHIAHANSVLEYGLKEVIVWGDYPWNRHQKLDRGMVRCVTWEDVFRERERIMASRK